MNVSRIACCHSSIIILQHCGELSLTESHERGRDWTELLRRVKTYFKGNPGTVQTPCTKWDRSPSFVHLCVYSSVHLLAHSTLWHISLVGAFICSDLHVWQRRQIIIPLCHPTFTFKKEEEELTVKAQIVLNSRYNFVCNPSPQWQQAVGSSYCSVVLYHAL